MRPFTRNLIGGLALLAGVKADVTYWMTSTCTETQWSEKQMWSTEWSTETYTQTAWSTYTPPAVTVSIPYTITDFYTQSIPYTITDTYTELKPYTITDTYTQPISIPYTITETDTSVVSYEKDYTTTVIQSTTVVSITTIYIHQTSTITQICTPITAVQPTTVTVPTTIIGPTLTKPTTVFTTSSITGFVLCPSRIINPTYTTSTPLPASYLWGCAPGTVCTPPQIDCNFEQNTPADSYYCSPDECLPAQPLPNFDSWNSKAGNACGPYPTVSGYFNVDPLFFDLTYSIFPDGGDYASSCSGGPTPCTAMPAVSQISDGQPQAGTGLPVSQISDGQPQAPTVCPVSQISDGQPQAPAVTARAHLAARQLGPLHEKCYETCNECIYMEAATGKPGCCSSGSDFSTQLAKCNSCNAKYAGAPIDAATVLDAIGLVQTYCSNVALVSQPGQSGSPFSSSPRSTIPLVTSSSTTHTISTSSSKTTTSSTSTSTSKSNITSPTPSPSKTTSTPIKSTSTTTPPVVSPSKSSSSSVHTPLPPPTSTSSPSTTASSPPPNSVMTSSIIVSSSITECVVITQISDGQPQVHPCTATGVPVSQISDGQPQATTAPATFSGAASHAMGPPGLFWSALLLFAEVLRLV